MKKTKMVSISRSHSSLSTGPHHHYPYGGCRRWWNEWLTSIPNGVNSCGITGQMEIPILTTYWFIASVLQQSN